MELIKQKNKQPFPSQEAAEKALAENELNPDIYGPYPCPDGKEGFVLAKHAEMVSSLDKALQAAKKEKEKERKRRISEGSRGSGVDREIEGEEYLVVKFHGRTDPQEAEHIEFSWNGDRVTCRRETELCLPRRFLNVCDCAVHQTYEPTRRSENPYRKAGIIKRRAYTVLREGSREEFLKMLKDGNDITRRDIALADKRDDI